MEPVTVSVEVPESREDVYAFLDRLANHESFTDHLRKDWEYSGPAAGAGANAKAKVAAPGSNEIVTIKVLEADPPQRIVEENVGARGRRRARGTYTLDQLPDGGTRVSFEFAWLEAPSLERFGAPLTRAFMRRANGRSMRRLAAALATRSAA
jgi:Polyketide cyclase / dehydrase and lipid transport